MSRLSFRARLFVILALFAAVPLLVLTLAWGGAMTRVLPLMAGKAAWDTVAATGAHVVGIARRSAADSASSRVIDEHERALLNASTRSRQFELIADRAPFALMAASLVLAGLLTFGAARVAGHLTRQMTRPLDEVVSWTEQIGRGESPPEPLAKGAPEFDVLRQGMRRMSRDIEAGRRAAVEAERLEAMRESARQVAHELKNPLTPIRFAVARLRGRVPGDLVDAVSVLDGETARLEEMARSFAQFGRLPDGPVAEVDVGELVANALRTSVPDEFPRTVDVEPGLTVTGRHDALGRALGNVLLNAVEACGGRGRLEVTARAEGAGASARVEIAVRDSGPGIDPAKLGDIFNPYVTGKAGGTGLGLAIVRQTLEAHGGSAVAENADGGGAVIRLSIPKTTRPAPEAA